ncbi:MAG: phosphatase PAP2 family protein [Holdemania filiformis]
MIAFSRIYLHVHYPSDVLAGCLVGICIGALLVRLMKQRGGKLASATGEKC